MDSGYTILTFINTLVVKQHQPLVQKIYTRNKKGSRDCNKSKETSRLRNCWLPTETLQTALTNICVCSCKHDSSWVVTSMHTHMNTFSSKSTRFNAPTLKLAGLCLLVQLLKAFYSHVSNKQSISLVLLTTYFALIISCRHITWIMHALIYWRLLIITCLHSMEAVITKMH